MDPIFDTASWSAQCMSRGWWHVTKWRPKIMKYHILSDMRSVNVAKFRKKILLSSRLHWQTNSHQHNWKHLIKSVPCFLFNMHTSYVLCLWSTARAVKLRDSVSVTFLWLVVSINSIKFQFIWRYLGAHRLNTNSKNIYIKVSTSGD